MKYLILLAGLTILFGCGNDPDTKYPVLYTLDHIDQSNEGHYLVAGSDDLTPISTTIGTFGAYKGELKQDIVDFFEVAFDLNEVELISEDSIRLNYFIDGQEYDTTLTYTSINDSIAIDSLEGGVIIYDKAEDQFSVCSVSWFALPGPNTIDPGLEYNSFHIEECNKGVTNIGFADDLLSDFNFTNLDTLGIILTHLVYK